MTFQIVHMEPSPSSFVILDLFCALNENLIFEHTASFGPNLNREYQSVSIKTSL